jgi:hypothetical protein
MAKADRDRQSASIGTYTCNENKHNALFSLNDRSGYCASSFGGDVHPTRDISRAYIFTSYSYCIYILYCFSTTADRSIA